jgi:thiol-disulfide isomerase/thioredoxin
MPKALIALLASLAMLAACTTTEDELGQGDIAPAWTGTTFAGASVSFPELLAGKPAIVVFWATWCSYCKAFMPYLESIQSDFGDAVSILAINAREDGRDDPAAYVAGLDFPLTAVRDGDAIAADYDVEFIPGLMIVGADGIVAYRRAWTDLPAGDQVASLWALQVRSNLNRLLR